VSKTNSLSDLWDKQLLTLRNPFIEEKKSEFHKTQSRTIFNNIGKYLCLSLNPHTHSNTTTFQSAPINVQLNCFVTIQSIQYRVRAVVEHASSSSQKSTYRGHYICIVNENDKLWYQYSDSFMGELTKKTQSEKPTIVLLERIIPFAKYNVESQLNILSLQPTTNLKTLLLPIKQSLKTDEINSELTTNSLDRLSSTLTTSQSWIDDALINYIMHYLFMFEQLIPNIYIFDQIILIYQNYHQLQTNKSIYNN
jgi:GTPase SAR1 family protein